MIVKINSISAVSNSVYHVRQSDGSVIDTSPLSLSMNDRLGEAREINAVVSAQYNNYPDFDLVRYINEGRSIGYVNTNPDLQPLVTTFVDTILRWDESLEYGDSISLDDVLVNAEGFTKMFFTSQTDKESGDTDFDFEDTSEETRDPRVAVFHSVVDSNNILGRYWIEPDKTTQIIESDIDSYDDSANNQGANGQMTSCTSVVKY